MKNSFTTIVDDRNDGVVIYTEHDQTGGCAVGWVPKENIEQLIKDLLNRIEGDERSVARKV